MIELLSAEDIQLNKQQGVKEQQDTESKDTQYTNSVRPFVIVRQIVIVKFITMVLKTD